MTTAQLRLVLNFLTTVTASWGRTCRTIVLVTGTLWIPVLIISELAGHASSAVPALAVCAVGGIGAGVRRRRRPRPTTGESDR